MNSFTEQNIATPGWYWFIPKDISAAGARRFAHVSADSIEDGWLKCRRYAGTYIGPIDVDQMEKSATPAAA